MSDLILYGRGFVGDEHAATKSVITTGSRQILSFFEHRREETEVFVSNEQVVMAYNQLIQRQVNAADFDWRERVVRIIINAFGTKSLNKWISACEKSPTFTKNHAECIEDWLSFCTAGKRKLSTTTWQRLIHPGVNDPAMPSLVNQELVNRIPDGFSQIFSCPSKGNNLIEVIHMALSQPQGFSDLLVTAYTFFGDTNNF